MPIRGYGDVNVVRGHWEQAYQHLRVAVRLLHDIPTPENELARLRREHAEAREQSRRDALTASYNRRYLDDPACRSSAGMNVALVDADHFKQVNDNYGHRFGDHVLQRIVAELGGRPARRRILRTVRRR